MKNITEVAKSLASSTHVPVNKGELEDVLELLYYDILFPICNKPCDIKRSILLASCMLHDNVAALMSEQKAEEVVNRLIDNLVPLQKELYAEAGNFLNNDPAAESIEEVILTYPGFFALTVHRISNMLAKMDVPIIPRLFSEYVHSKVGIDIHPNATIGRRFYIDHGTGIVIGGTTVIGDNVKIYQGVTLGALAVSKALSGVKRHPTIEDNVVIYAGTTILGGDTVIGRDSIIGGNVWLTKSVPANSLVQHDPEIRII